MHTLFWSINSNQYKTLKFVFFILRNWKKHLRDTNTFELYAEDTVLKGSDTNGYKWGSPYSLYLKAPSKPELLL